MVFPFAFIADIPDVDSKLWDSFDINVVPTMAIFKDGKLKKKWDGILGRGLTINQIEDANSFFSKVSLPIPCKNLVVAR